jgi:hypothetical protein
MFRVLGVLLDPGTRRVERRERHLDRRVHIGSSIVGRSSSPCT